MLLKSIAQSFAFWKPEELPDLLDKKGEKPSRDDIDKAIKRAEEIKGMKLKETT